MDARKKDILRKLLLKVALKEGASSTSVKKVFSNMKDVNVGDIVDAVIHAFQNKRLLYVDFWQTGRVGSRRNRKAESFIAGALCRVFTQLLDYQVEFILDTLPAELAQANLPSPEFVERVLDEKDTMHFRLIKVDEGGEGSLVGEERADFDNQSTISAPMEQSLRLRLWDRVELGSEGRFENRGLLVFDPHELVRELEKSRRESLIPVPPLEPDQQPITQQLLNEPPPIIQQSLVERLPSIEPPLDQPPRLTEQLTTEQPLDQPPLITEQPLDQPPPTIEQLLDQPPPTIEQLLDQPPPTIEQLLDQPPPTIEQPLDQPPPSIEQPLDQVPPIIEQPLDQLLLITEQPLDQPPPSIEQPLDQVPPIIEQPLDQTPLITEQPPPSIEQPLDQPPPTIEQPLDQPPSAIEQPPLEAAQLQHPQEGAAAEAAIAAGAVVVDPRDILHTGDEEFDEEIQRMTAVIRNALAIEQELERAGAQPVEPAAAGRRRSHTVPQSSSAEDEAESEGSRSLVRPGRKPPQSELQVFRSPDPEGTPPFNIRCKHPSEDIVGALDVTWMRLEQEADESAGTMPQPSRPSLDTEALVAAQERARNAEQDLQIRPQWMCEAMEKAASDVSLDEVRKAWSDFSKKSESLLRIATSRKAQSDHIQVSCLTSLAGTHVSGDSSLLWSVLLPAASTPLPAPQATRELLMRMCGSVDQRPIESVEEPQALLPEEPQALLPEEPQALLPEEPQALLPEEPQALLPEEPQALLPEGPQALLPEEPQALLQEGQLAVPAGEPQAMQPEGPQALLDESQLAVPASEPQAVLHEDQLLAVPAGEPQALQLEGPQVGPVGEPQAVPPEGLLAGVQVTVSEGAQRPRTTPISLPQPSRRRQMTENSVMRVLEELWATMDQVTFEDLCPPNKVRRATAETAFRILNEMRGRKVVLEQPGGVGNPLYIKEIRV